MNLSLVALSLWVVAAALFTLLPRRLIWRAAAVLIVTGIPLVGWVTYANGPLAGLLALAVGASVLRWPILRAGQWVLRKTRGH